ncbi:MAG: ATP-binding protein [Parachlamydia sp.]|nr:ATP-binding protein [Parachlamydia sp.]
MLHAPRQTGKTTAVEEFTDYLNNQGSYSVLYINIEPAQATRDNVKEALIALLSELKASLRNQLPKEEATIEHNKKLLREPLLVTYTTLIDVLEFWAKASPKPKVLFIDEIDSLIGDSLLSVLRQVRRGFSKRPESFPQSICLSVFAMCATIESGHEKPEYTCPQQVLSMSKPNRYCSPTFP